MSEVFVMPRLELKYLRKWYCFCAKDYKWITWNSDSVVKCPICEQEVDNGK